MTTGIMLHPLRRKITQPRCRLLGDQYILIMRKHSVYISHSGKKKVKSQSSQPLSKPCTAVFVKWDSKLDEPEEFSSFSFLPCLFIWLYLTGLKGLQSKA